ncbi:MAG: histidine phosphatase family protein [Pseudomonadota bacterium]
MTAKNGSKDVWFVRHAESITNAGGAWDDPATIPLTPLGYTQVNRVTEKLKTHTKPSLIVTSPYIRTHETAKPILAYWDDVEHVVWPIHEFTYLSAERLGVTTMQSRFEDMSVYWNRNDPDYVDGPDAESYREFIGRVDETIARIREIAQPNTLIFSHGQFLKALFYRLEYAKDGGLFPMSDLRKFSQEFSVKNTSVARYTFYADEQEERHSLSIDHLL